MRSAATVASQSQSSKLITSARKCFKLACRGCGAWENSHKELEPLQITMFKLTWLSYQIIELSNLLSSFLQELFIGHAIQDQEPAIIHYFDFSWFSFPDFAAGWALSVPLLNRQVRVKVFFFFNEKKRQIKQFFFSDSNFAVIFWNRNFLVLVSLREPFFPQKFIRGISDRILEVWPRNESFSRNICSRGLGYVPFRLDRRAHERVYREMRKCSQDQFTHVSVGKLLV